MAHIHSVHDSDTHFLIDPITRMVQNQSGKVIIVQHDHNSERLTFSIPRTVDGHDMSTCNKVQVHYINTDVKTQQKSIGIYDVDDLRVDPENSDAVICSWLIPENATRYVGSLLFVVRFSCVSEDGAVIDYAWNTAAFSGISVATGIFNSEGIIE